MTTALKRTRHTLLGAAAVLAFHALLLALLLWVWPRVERAHSVNESTRIEVSLVVTETLKPQAPTVVAPTETRSLEPKPSGKPPAAVPRTSLTLAPAAPALVTIQAEVETANVPLSAASSVLNSAATKDAIKQASRQRTLAETTREDLGELQPKGIGKKLNEDFGNASIPDCIQPNTNSAGLINIPLLAYKALTGECK